MEGLFVRVSVPTVWVDQCSKSVHQTPQAIHGTLTAERNPMYYLSGRHVGYGTVKRGLGETDPGHCQLLISHQLGQICPLPYSGDRLPWTPDRYYFNGDILTTRESQDHRSDLQSCHGKGTDISPG